MNPNKWMLVNFDCSTMWLVQQSQDIISQKKTITMIDQQRPQSRVRDRYLLTQALVVDPLYLQHSYSESAIDYRVGLILPKKVTMLPRLKQGGSKRTRQWYLNANRYQQLNTKQTPHVLMFSIGESHYQGVSVLSSSGLSFATTGSVIVIISSILKMWHQEFKNTLLPL